MTVRTQQPKADARVRALRTLRQGALSAAVLAGAGAVAQWLQDGEYDWTQLGVSAGTAALMAALAYVERAFVDPRRK